MKIASRTRGKTDVYLGAPCPSGHDGIRYQSTGQCVECKRARGRKGAATREVSLNDAVKNQSRWIAAFESNYAQVALEGISNVLGSAYHKSKLQLWLYRMRTRWDDHDETRKDRLLALGESAWWLRTDIPRHQKKLGFAVGSEAHKAHKKASLDEWRERNRANIRAKYRDYYKSHEDQRQKAAANRARRFRENPGLAAYLTSLRRKREKSQRCTCCSNIQFREAYLKNAERGLETDHIISLAVALELGLTGKHCVTNLQGLTPDEHKRKTGSDIGALAELRRARKIPYHKWRKRIASASDSGDGSQSP